MESNILKIHFTAKCVRVECARECLPMCSVLICIYYCILIFEYILFL